MFKLSHAIVALAVIIFSSWVNAAAPVNDRPPNIIFILADDLGYGDTSIYGSEVIDTPHIDSLAGSGVRFTNAYVSHPVCSPSRAGLLTGQYQQRHGWEFNPMGQEFGHNKGLSLEVRTIADELREQGYSTGMVGKWHLGSDEKFHPLSRGFDEFYGILGGGSQYFESIPDGGAVALSSPVERDAYKDVYRGFERVGTDKYLTDAFTDAALSFIGDHEDEPYFLYLSHTTPHTPLQATKTYLDRYGHILDIPTRVYSAMVASLDDSVGAVIRKLKESGQYENTLIVFSSDNGCPDYIGNACSNGNFAGFKRYHQDGGVRVPLILSWQGVIPSASVYAKTVTLLDLMSTFTSAAGKQIDTEDGVNLMPFIAGNISSNPHEYLYWRSGPTMAIKDDRWKLIKYKRVKDTENDLRGADTLTPPQNGWSVEAPLGHLTLLYDLQEDPGETTNLADSHPEVVSRLGKAYSLWSQQLPPVEDAILPARRSTITEIDDEAVQLIF